MACDCVEHTLGYCRRRLVTADRFHQRSFHSKLDARNVTGWRFLFDRSVNGGLWCNFDGCA